MTAIEGLQATLNGLGLKVVEAWLEGSFRPSSKMPCLQPITFQADTVIPLKPVEPC